MAGRPPSLDYEVPMGSPLRIEHAVDYDKWDPARWVPPSILCGGAEAAEGTTLVRSPFGYRYAHAPAPPDGTFWPLAIVSPEVCLEGSIRNLMNTASFYRPSLCVPIHDATFRKIFDDIRDLTNAQRPPDVDEIPTLYWQREPSAEDREWFEAADATSPLAFKFIPLQMNRAGQLITAFTHAMPHRPLASFTARELAEGPMQWLKGHLVIVVKDLVWDTANHAMRIDIVVDSVLVTDLFARPLRSRASLTPAGVALTSGAGGSAILRAAILSAAAVSKRRRVTGGEEEISEDEQHKQTINDVDEVTTAAAAAPTTPAQPRSSAAAPVAPGAPPRPVTTRSRIGAGGGAFATGSQTQYPRGRFGPRPAAAAAGGRTVTFRRNPPTYTAAAAPAPASAEDPVNI